jgi:hypothetical protein
MKTAKKAKRESLGYGLSLEATELLAEIIVPGINKACEKGERSFACAEVLDVMPILLYLEAYGYNVETIEKANNIFEIKVEW